jgi:DNA-binding transcriptional LysR family regulator
MVDMDRFEVMRIFVAVADCASFTQAADRLGLSKAAVSSGVRDLEARVGVRLFHRTTRTVRLTQDGVSFYERCAAMLADMDELETTFQHGEHSIQGRLRVDMPAQLARNIVVPRLPEFFAVHPKLMLELSCTDRRVDLISEGFDCVLRIGTLPDSSLIAKPLGYFRTINCASPAYIKRFGMPKNLHELSDHRLVYYALNLGAKPEGFEYFDGETYRSFEMAGVLMVNNTDAYEAACAAGLGIIQAPDIGLLRMIDEGSLVELLPQLNAEPMPVSLIYANRKHLSKRVQVFMAWLQTILSPYLVPISAVQNEPKD